MGHAKPLCILQEHCFEATALVLGKLPPSSTSLKPPCLLFLMLWLSIAPLLVSVSALSACLLLSGLCCSSAAPPEASCPSCCNAASRLAETTPVASVCTGTGLCVGKSIHSDTWPVWQTPCNTHLRRPPGAPYPSMQSQWQASTVQTSEHITWGKRVLVCAYVLHTCSSPGRRMVTGTGTSGAAPASLMRTDPLGAPKPPRLHSRIRADARSVDTAFQHQAWRCFSGHYGLPAP